ncbi:MAG: hypothetical protein NTY10_00720 [Candidatus Omnitrophica bacterium]|nr:hypothetical protein [Candidatus Omnitrophota bacterium]
MKSKKAIEVWTDGAIDATSGKCSRCVAGRLASGKTMDAYLKDQATRALKDLYNSVAAIVPTIPGYRMPTVMGYDYSKYRRYHNFIVDFNQVYPQYIDAAQPSLYVGARPQTIHDEIRANYFGSPGISAAIGINTKDSTFADTRADRKYIIPWLSTGTYANIKPYREYQQVLETILNGAAGLTYFWYGDFDTPLEFYYQAKALAEIAPYEDLIMDGTVLTPTGTNTNLHYSGIMSSLRRDMILLVGNYQKDAAVTTYTAPWGVLSQVTDLETGLPVSTVSGGQITLDILADGTRLLYIMGPLFNITATSGANGAIFPPGVTQYPYGDTPSFIITPASGYWLKSLVVDRASQDTQLGQRNFYTFLPIITDNHTIDVTFKPFYTITASSGANGAIVPGGKILAGQGESRTFTIRSNSGYRINTLLVDGVLTDTTSGDTQYTFANITGNHTIAVTFQVTHTIAASNGAHGKISPLGTLTVGHGETQAFTITPDAGYCLATMLIDGVSRDTGISGSLGSYVFTNVIVNHKIVVTFKLSRAITATAGSGGSISPVGIIPIGYGDAQTFTIAPTLGNQLVALLVDGVLKDTGGGNLPSYTFINVTANHTIAASFEINTYTITASAGPNGSISPEGLALPFNYGDTQKFTIAPATNYHIATVTVDGNLQDPVPADYTFSAISANHTIAATFAITSPPSR